MYVLKCRLRSTTEPTSVSFVCAHSISFKACSVVVLCELGATTWLYKLPSDIFLVFSLNLWTAFGKILMTTKCTLEDTS